MPDIKEAHALVKLLPEQVAGSWDKLRPAIRQSLPPQVAVSNEAMKQILESLLADRGDVWVYRDGNTLTGMVVTTIHKDPLSGARSLLLYSIFAFQELTQEAIENSMETLQKHAEEHDIDEVIAFSANDALSRYFEEHHGADASYRLIRFNP